MPSALSRLLRPALAVFVALAAMSCAHDENAVDGGAPSAVTLAPLPAPAGLLAEMTLSAPDATWQKARALVGGPAVFLPQSSGALAATLLGLPITIAPEIDGAVPIVGAVVDAPGEPRPRAAIGIHVKAGDRFVQQLTAGQSARYSSRVDPATQVTLLDSKGGKAALAMGVLGNYLLLAEKEADLIEVGPFVARTVSTRTAPKDELALDVPGDALGGPLRAKLEKMWAALKPAADASGPTSLIGPLISVSSVVDTLLPLLGDLQRGRVSLNLEPGFVRARVSLDAKPGLGPAMKTIAGMAGGDLRPALELPAGTMVAMVLRETAASRKASAPARAEALAKVLGKSASAADREAIAKAVQGLADGRGDWVSAGFRLGGTGPAAYVRGAVADADLLGHSMKDFVAIARTPGAKELLAELELGISAKKTTVEKVGDVERIRFERAPAKGAAAKLPSPVGGKVVPPPADAVDLFYTIGKEVFVAAAGLDAKAALVSVTSTPEGKLEGTPSIRAAMEALGGDVTFGLVVEPLLALAAFAGKPGAADSAPVALALGRTPPSGEDPGRIWLRFDVADADVQELVRRRGAF